MRCNSYTGLDIFSIMATIIRNEIGDQSSNPGRGSLSSLCVNVLGKDINQSVLSSAMGK